MGHDVLQGGDPGGLANVGLEILGLVERLFDRSVQILVVERLLQQSPHPLLGESERPGCPQVCRDGNHWRSRGHSADLSGQDKRPVVRCLGFQKNQIGSSGESQVAGSLGVGETSPIAQAGENVGDIAFYTAALLHHEHTLRGAFQSSHGVTVPQVTALLGRVSDSHQRVLLSLQPTLDI
jgi:hypothetical protein